MKLARICLLLLAMLVTSQAVANTSAPWYGVHTTDTVPVLAGCKVVASNPVATSFWGQNDNPEFISNNISRSLTSLINKTKEDGWHAIVGYRKFMTSSSLGSSNFTRYFVDISGVAIKVRCN